MSYPAGRHLSICRCSSSRDKKSTIFPLVISRRSGTVMVLFLEMDPFHTSTTWKVPFSADCVLTTMMSVARRAQQVGLKVGKISAVAVNGTNINSTQRMYGIFFMFRSARFNPAYEVVSAISDNHLNAIVNANISAPASSLPND